MEADKDACHVSVTARPWISCVQPDLPLDYREAIPLVTAAAESLAKRAVPVLFTRALLPVIR